MNRQTWKAYYRQLRIINREALKAASDTMIFGVGYLRISEDGFVNHILPQALYFEAP